METKRGIIGIIIIQDGNQNWLANSLQCKYCTCKSNYVCILTHSWLATNKPINGYKSNVRNYNNWMIKHITKSLQIRCNVCTKITKKTC